jgi:hypothetical protein
LRRRPRRPGAGDPRLGAGIRDPGHERRFRSRHHQIHALTPRERHQPRDIGRPDVVIDADSTRPRVARCDQDIRRPRQRHGERMLASARTDDEHAHGPDPC